VTQKPLQIHPSALDEAEAAAIWYAERSPRAAIRFVNELEGAMARISERPEQFPLSDDGTRRMVLHRFPFLVVFRETPSSIEIIAIAHGRRRPGYWRERT
jgi:plasmid stabilization system protein ParE